MKLVIENLINVNTSFNNENSFIKSFLTNSMKHEKPTTWLNRLTIMER